jgi:hypothetical protein
MAGELVAAPSPMRERAAVSGDADGRLSALTGRRGRNYWCLDQIR